MNKHRIVVDRKDSLKYRFESSFTKKNEKECWIWNKKLDKQGYGVFFSGKDKSCRAHRFSYTFYIGEIPSGLLVCHKCDNRSCVNPSHLWIGTNKDNMADMKKKGRSQRAIGESHSRSIMTSEMVKLIKIRIKNGEAMAKIARDFNIAYSTIANLKYGLCWNHIEI